MQKNLSAFLIFLLIALITACSSDQTLEELNLSEDELYQRIQDELNDQHYDLAATSIQSMEARYPFGKYAEHTQLESIYIYYMQYDNEGSRAAAEVKISR